MFRKLATNYENFIPTTTRNLVRLNQQLWNVKQLKFMLLKMKYMKTLPIPRNALVLVLVPPQLKMSGRILLDTNVRSVWLRSLFM